MNRELFPSELEQLVKPLEINICYLEKEFDFRALNSSYEQAMALWDVDNETALGYVRILNSISRNYLLPHKPTLHH